MKASEKDRLYRILENKICERIFRGEYADGENLPPERTLAESLGVSRVTVRKARALLEADGIIQRVQGSGNRVALSVAGYPGTTDLIAVLAHAQNVFFAEFIDYFQRTAELSDSLVLFKQVPASEALEASLFKLFQKNIRNAVIWLEDQPVDMEAIRRLRGLGMNMVFFDVVTRSPYADGVLLDNRDAIASLHGALRRKGAGRIGYVGWDNAAVLSAHEREQAANEQTPAPAFVRRIDWRDKNRLGQIAETIADEIKPASTPPDALLCGDGEIGVAIRKALLTRGLAAIRVASPDEYPDSRALSITVYRQDFEKLAEQTFNCLLAQNRPGWSASVFPIRGELVEPAAAD